MKCRWCQSDRIAHVAAKCSDMCGVRYAGKEHDGYVPAGLGIGEGDYIEFAWCFECGGIQFDGFPIEEEEVQSILGDGSK